MIRDHLTDLESRFGKLTIDHVAALAFHASLGSMVDPVSNALDARIAIKPNLVVADFDVLEIASCLHQSSGTTTASTIMAVSASGNSNPPRQARDGRPFFRRNAQQKAAQGSSAPSTPSNGSSGLAPDLWAKRWLTAEFPCNICWEWGIGRLIARGSKLIYLPWKTLV